MRVCACMCVLFMHHTLHSSVHISFILRIRRIHINIFFFELRREVRISLMNLHKHTHTQQNWIEYMNEQNVDGNNNNWIYMLNNDFYCTLLPLLYCSASSTSNSYSAGAKLATVCYAVFLLSISLSLSISSNRYTFVQYWMYKGSRIESYVHPMAVLRTIHHVHTQYAKVYSICVRMIEKRSLHARVCIRRT